MAKPLKQLRCLVCGYEWYPRSSERPRVCANPRCRSTRWDVGRARPPIALQRQNAANRQKIKLVEKKMRLPVLGIIAGGHGYSVMPIEVRWVKPPPGVKFKPGDYCLIVERLPEQDDIITDALEDHNIAVFRPGAAYLGRLAHIEAAGTAGENTVYFAQVKLMEDGSEVALEPMQLTLPLEQLEVRGTFTASYLLDPGELTGQIGSEGDEE